MTRSEYEYKWKQCHSSSEHVDVCEDYIKSLEQQLSDMQKRIDELEDVIYANSKQIDELKAQRMELWMLLDNIDSSEDIAKDSDSMFRGLCRNEYSKRWDIYEPNDIEG